MFWISAGNTWCSKYRPLALERRIRTGAHSPGPFRLTIFLVGCCVVLFIRAASPCSGTSAESILFIQGERPVLEQPRLLQRLPMSDRLSHEPKQQVRSLVIQGEDLLQNLTIFQ